MTSFVISNSIQIVYGALVFGGIWWTTRNRWKNDSKLPETYLLYSKGRYKKAIRKYPCFNWKIGFLYAALFFWIIPLLVWRYGKWITVLLIGIPAAISSVIFNWLFLFATGSAANLGISLMFGWVVGRVISGAVGVYLASKDSELASRHLMRSGWDCFGEVDAQNEKAALCLADTRDAPIR